MITPDPASCPSLDILSELLSGDLKEDAFESLSSHVSTCEECSRKIESLDTVAPGLPTILQNIPIVSSGFSVHGKSALRFSSGPPLISDQVPRQISEYEILEPIGQGGMGVVYKARHRELHRIVAIKFLPAHLFKRPEARRRFDREMKAAGLCDHPNIVRTHDARKSGDIHFFVMEYIEGRTLSSIIADDGPFEIADACSICCEITRALQYIYDRNVVHRDVKPSNVMLTDSGEVKLLDLGLSRMQAETSSDDDVIDNASDETKHGESALTITAGVLGTSSYMSPEQWLYASETDIRADVYSLGCTLYHMLSGQPPFSGQSYSTNWRSSLAHRSMPPRRLAAFRSDVPEELEIVIRRMLSKDVEERYSTPEDVNQALQPFSIDSTLVSSNEKTASTSITTHQRFGLSPWQLVSLTAALTLTLTVALLLPYGIWNNRPPTKINAQPALPPEEKLARLVEDGYDAFEAGDFEKAELLFRKAKQIDQGHEGAVFGWIRATFRLGDVEAAQRAAAGIFNDGTPEKSALSGLCHAGIEAHSVSKGLFREAIAGGLKTSPVLTNLGYSLYRSGEYDEAIEVLNEARLMGGDTTIANLVQVYCYSSIWQRRDKKTGQRIHKFDDQLLVKMIEECREVPAKYKVASEIYLGMIYTLEGLTPEKTDEWARRSFDAFKRGVDIGLDPAYWERIRALMPPSILALKEAREFTDQIDGAWSPQHRTFYLRDPLVGTRFDRWTERKLPVGPITND